MFLDAFHPEATLTIYPADGTRSNRRIGHDEIGGVIKLIGAYSKTFHLVGQCLYDIGEGEATGEVYCVAHHLTSKGLRREDLIMYIRYDDAYRPDADDDWKIASRAVRVDWTESRDIAGPAKP